MRAARAVASFAPAHSLHAALRAGELVDVVVDVASSPVPGYCVVQRNPTESGPLRGFAPANHLVFATATAEELSCAGGATVKWACTGPQAAALRVPPGTRVRVLGSPFPGWLDAATADGWQRGLLPEAYVEDVSEAPKSFEPLLQLLIGADLSLFKALGLVARPTSVEKLGKALLRVFQDNGQEVRALRAAVECEVALATASEGVMFRRNSVNSTLLAAYARSAGAAYMVQVLQPTIIRIAQGTESYEVDTARQEGGDAHANAANVVQRCEELLTALETNVDTLPPAVGYICATLARVVRENLPDAKEHVAIGGFFMLRFVCPCIMAPDGVLGMVSPRADRRRGLVLLSKVLITLSNDVEFGRKEPFMAVFDSLLAPARQRLHQFLVTVAARYATVEADAHVVLRSPPFVVDAPSVATVHSFILREDLPLLMTALQSTGGSPDKLSLALQAAPAVEEPPERVAVASDSRPVLQQKWRPVLAELEKSFPSVARAPADEKELLARTVLRMRQAQDRERALSSLAAALRRDRSQRVEYDRVREELAFTVEEVATLKRMRDELFAKMKAH